MAETTEGLVLEADETSFKLDGQGWFKYSKQARPPAARVTVGQTVRVEYMPKDWEGKTYKWVNKTAVVAAAKSAGVENGVSRDDQITWNVALKAAVDCLAAGLAGDQITPNAVLMFAEALYAGRPGAEPPEPEPEYEAEPSYLEEPR